MTAEGEFLVHGLGFEPVRPDWAPLQGSEVADVLEAADLRVTSVRVAWRSPRPFSAAAIVLPEGAGGAPLFVKRHHRSVRSADSLREEHRFTSHLSRAGLTVPLVLGLVERDVWVYEVQELSPGVDLYRDALSWTPFRSVEHARSAGSALAELHLASEGYGAPPRSSAPVMGAWDVAAAGDAAEALAGYLARRPGLAAYLAPVDWHRDLASHVVPACLRLREALGAPPSQVFEGLWTHNDWHPSNMSWTSGADDAQVAGVFDFGLCNRTAAVYDLATAIERTAVEWLLPGESRPTHLGHVEAMFNGYQSVRRLSPEERLAIPLLLPVAHVEFALSEIDYFHSVVGSAENARVAYDDYLVGHARWFESDRGRRFLSGLEALLQG